jgi:KDO2-lipid IV(A) lauroyltransferase
MKGPPRFIGCALKAPLVKAILRLSSVLPLGLVRAFGRGVGLLYWLVGGRNRKVTQRNIELAFPGLAPGEQGKLVRHSLYATGELVAEMGHIWLRPWSYVSTLVTAVHGDSSIIEAQASGRGVVVLAPHLGNWEVIGLHLAVLGNTVSLYEPPQLAGLGPLIEQARQSSGATLVPTNSSGLAKLFKSLKNGGIAGILPDQTPADIKSGEDAPFMGIPCFTGTLASKLVRRTGALAVFGFAERVPGGFVVHYKPAEEAIYDADMAVSLAALNRGTEACLRQCVAQYQWEYKRFRVRPRQGPGLYEDLK